ncbi:hypothetical protein ACHAXS_012018 [Conticribra weissflogii]
MSSDSGFSLRKGRNDSLNRMNSLSGRMYCRSTPSLGSLGLPHKIIASIFLPQAIGIGFALTIVVPFPTFG